MEYVNNMNSAYILTKHYIVIFKMPTLNLHFPYLKGIVHPKMNILSSFTHPQVVPNQYECLCSAENKGRYSEECGKHQFWGTIDFHSIFFPTMEVNGAPKQPVTNFLQNIFLYIRQNKSIHTGLELLKGWVNDDRNVIFGWTIPLRLTTTYNHCCWTCTHYCLNTSLTNNRIFSIL